MTVQRVLMIVVAALILGAGLTPGQQGKDPPIVNTQNPKDVPPTPQQALEKITLPPGFNVTLFAGDPDVRQPISINLDDRGRLWVAECYSYSGASGAKAWVPDHKDRVLIFEDEDNDGRFDKRTVFIDGLQNLSSVVTGFGGAWVLCTPNLLFIPDKNGDDVPDGKAEVVLDGFVVGGIGHNVVNGLMWGPDGWLYGRHGIQDTSHVGTPGTPPAQRTKLNCAIWRYHPTKKRFEVVTWGTTNPWGMDYDDHGQMFFTNNVNGHLWHVIPGAHFKRMYGEDFNPYLYELIDQHADHVHYEDGKAWHEAREGKKTDELGGGHSHVGAMIYLGDNWPAKYRNTLFTCNTHGRRINNDILERKGSGYVAKHGKDFMFANNPWFRGIELKYGPDGGVYVADWTDLGECHDHDGIHRTSGRIYKITYGKVNATSITNLAKKTNAQLVALQLSKNDWHVRVARRLLQERAAAGQDMKAVHVGLRKIFDSNPDVTRKLRALWALYATGGTNSKWLGAQLDHKSEHVRAWAVRLLVDDGKADAATRSLLEERAATASSLVRLYLASALQRLPVPDRFDLAMPLIQRCEDASDHNLPLLIWYGVEPLVGSNSAKALELLKVSELPRVAKLIARRLTEDLAKNPGPVDQLVLLAKQRPVLSLEILQGMNEALKGWHKAPPPPSWNKVKGALAPAFKDEIAKLVQSLDVIFGDGQAIGELTKLALDAKAEGHARRSALKVLIDNKTDDLLPLLMKLVSDRATVTLAVKGLAAYDDPKVPALVLQYYHFIPKEERDTAITTLVSRPSYAAELLKAVDTGKISASDVSAFHARQIINFGKADLKKQLAKVWGDIRTTPAEKKQQIDQYRKLLTPQKLKSASLAKGRILFKTACANCHMLYGEGATVGPDITGGNRDNLDYLLENIIDPSAIVAANFRMSIVAMTDGRIYNGVVLSQTDQILTLQAEKEQLKLPRTAIDDIQPTPLSLMPDGLFNNLKQEQIVDLIGYLMSPTQVPLPPEIGKQ